MFSLRVSWQSTCLFKERVPSDMKISDKIKLDPNIVPFAFFFSKSASFPSDINSGPKISLPWAGLSLPGTWTIASEDLHFSRPASLLPDLH